VSVLRGAALLALATLPGCYGCIGDPSMHGPFDQAVPDLAMGQRRDLSAPIDAPLDAPVDDLTMPVDLASADLSGCAAGFLNSDAGDACPLACSPAVEKVPDEGNMHVAFGTPIVYQHNPPASGPHWPFPAPWGVHPEIVPPEWWVHNLEHGGVVLLYNCPLPADAGTDADGGPLPPNACPNEIAAYQQLYAQAPVLNYYDMIFETKILVTADPDLPTRFAAVAWDWDWTSDTLDLTALQCFIAARYDRGPENAP
jgi:hypothetical protein